MTLQEQIALFKVKEELGTAFNATNAFITIINPLREIVYANKALYNFRKIEDEKQVLGRKLGEVFQCIHSDKEITGCGTSEYCTECAALGIMKRSIATNTVVAGEAVITYRLEDSELPLNIYEHIQPIEIENHMYYVISLIDISDRVKRRFMEKIFFHDILNTTGALKGLLQIVQDDVQGELREEVELVKLYFDHVIDEIQSQKQILEAETNELQVSLVSLNSLEFLKTVSQGYQRLEEYKQYTITLDHEAQDIWFTSDRALLRRVLSNMLKNALEASAPQDKVILGCRIEDNGKSLVFWVKNKAYLYEEVQKRIFQRSYSTKGKGRGLGTYSIKLLGEKYLRGKVSFTSDKAEGTTFFLKIPMKLTKEDKK